ncbi:acyl-CoA dehydrogenase [Sphingomonas oryzagri]
MTIRPSPSSKVLDDVVERLAALGARYDAAPLFPSDSLATLVGAGLHRRFAPVSSGGEAFANETARNDALAQALRLVGRGDLSIGRLFEGHVNALHLFDWYATTEQLGWLDHVLGAGAWFGVWATEPPPGVRLDEDGTTLVGAKMFASGAGGLDYTLATVASAGNTRRLAIVPADDCARTDLSGWRVRGMRASASGRYDLTGLSIAPDMWLGRPGDYDRDPRFTAGAWRFCAVQLGGLEALLTETIAGLGDTGRSDPVQRARLVDFYVATRTAGFWVREAARRAAAAEDDAIAIARLARGVVERAALDGMEASARLLGTRSAFDGERIDKIIRDLSLYLRQAGPDHARDCAAQALLDHDVWPRGDRLW